MAKNLEIKAICPDLEQTESIVKKIATEYLGLDTQTDTYFCTKNGRFKLRESSLSGSYLIPYLRPDQSDAKVSMYAKIDIESPSNVKSLFKELLGIQIIVKKKRTIYLYENVRIHLDEVEGLGTFIELEAVFDDKDNFDEQTQKMKVDYLMQKIDIKTEMLLAVSYENLLKDKLSEQ